MIALCEYRDFIMDRVNAGAASGLISPFGLADMGPKRTTGRITNMVALASRVDGPLLLVSEHVIEFVGHNTYASQSCGRRVILR